LSEAVPLIERIEAQTDIDILRRQAQILLATLRPARDALPHSALLERLTDWLDAVCRGASGPRQDTCASLSNALTTATGQLAANQPGPARDALTALAARADAAFQQGVLSDAEHRLFADNARYVTSRLVATFFLRGSGGTANPPTLVLSSAAPTTATASFKDSPAIRFTGGNAWAEVGTWTAGPALTSGTLGALGATQLWLGLKNSDDIGTNLDLRVEAYKNGTMVAAGQALCIQGVTRNPDNAKAVAVSFAPFSAVSFDGTADRFSLRVLTRTGTNSTGASCGGHANAVGLRLYFDSVTRAARVAATF
jgi:hypothetical protein